MNLALLTATLAALLCGPLLYAVARHRAPLLAFLDGFVLVAISGLVLMEVLPEAFKGGGAWTFGFLLLGALGPTLFEHQLQHAREVHVAALMLAIAGLVLHSVADGMALAPQTAAPGEAQLALGLAIAVHSVPVGLAVWWLLYPVFGAAMPALSLAAMGAGTVAGYGFGGALEGLFGATASAWFQALVAGSILHVVFGRPHLDEHSAQRQGPPPFEGLGNLVALGGLVVLEALHLPGEHVHGFWDRLLQLSLQMAPALLAAYVAGGWLGSSPLQRRLAASPSPAAQAVGATALGLWLPMCACNVLPRYRALALGGAPLAAALAFLVATSEMGLAALFVSLPLLGPQMSLLRAGAAALLALLVAVVMARAFPQRALPHCAPAPGHAQPPLQPAAEAPGGRLQAALRGGFVELVDGTAGWIVFGLVLAAFVTPHVATVGWVQLPDALEVGLFALLGLPLYVCAAGVTPLVAAFVAGGVSPGAAIAFLLTGPATNVATLAVLRQLHGARFTALFAALVLAGAIALGLAVNALGVAPAAPLLDGRAAGALHWLSLAVVTLVFAASLLRRGGRSFFGELFEPGAAAGL